MSGELDVLRCGDGVARGGGFVFIARREVAALDAFRFLRNALRKYGDVAMVECDRGILLSRSSLESDLPGDFDADALHRSLVLRGLVCIRDENFVGTVR